MSRVTHEITYDLKETGRRYTGKDRSKLDIPATVKIINSPEVQELVKTGAMIGWNGHQIRQRFGMYPPESIISGDGKVTLLEPAFKTVSLSASKDGIVTHKQEFFENPTGEHCYIQFKANQGGFSTACEFEQDIDGTVRPVVFAGFDYVYIPNYVGNKGNGTFDAFDSIGADSPAFAMVRQLLEEQICQMYDNIHSQFQLTDLARQAFNRVQQLEQEAADNERKARLRRERLLQKQQEMYDSALCPTVPADAMLEQANLFLQQQQAKADKQAEGNLSSNFLGRLLG